MSSQASSSEYSETVSSQASSHPENEKLRHFIEVVIKTQDGREDYYRMRRKVEMNKLLTYFCNRRFLDYNSIRFLIEGEFFPHNKTPEELGLEDGTQIDAMMMQIGGGIFMIN